MPRAKRQDDVPTYELTPEETAFELRLFEAERNLIAKIEQLMTQPRLNSRDLGFMANAIAKMRSETRARFKLVGRLSLSAKEASQDPEEARKVCRAFLTSLSLLDRLSIYEGVCADDSVVAWLAGMEESRLKTVFHKVRGVRQGDLSVPIAAPSPTATVVWRAPMTPHAIVEAPALSAAPPEAVAINEVAPIVPQATGAEV